MNDELSQRAFRVIPGGMYGHQSIRYQSERTPQFFERAKGAYVWDYQGNRYIDFLSGYGPNLLGYGHEEIDKAYIRQLAEVDTALGPSSRIVELAEAYVDQITHADWALFCKNGSDATTAALMIARAYRAKPKILAATGAYHGAAPWSTPGPLGTLPEDRAHILYYEYNNTESLMRAVEQAGDDLAGIFASPFKHDVIVPQELPDPVCAEAIRRACDEKDALLIVDDVRAGFRLDRDCSWQALGVEPDLSTWGKSLANGHPISCLMGNERAREAASKVFVTGSFWFASAAMAAALKTLEIIRTTDYLERMIRSGTRLRDGIAGIARDHSVDIDQSGPVQMPLIMINDDHGNRDLDASSLFCDALLDHGIYFHPFHNLFISAAMSDADIDQTLDAVASAVKRIHRTLANW